MFIESSFEMVCLERSESGYLIERSGNVSRFRTQRSSFLELLVAFSLKVSGPIRTRQTESAEYAELSSEAEFAIELVYPLLVYLFKGFFSFFTIKFKATFF